MTSDRSRLLGAVIALVGACAADVPVIERSGQARREVTLSAAGAGELVSYRWELVEAPVGSRITRPLDTTPAATFTPDMRGVYLVDRWVVAGVAEDLSHHFLITAAGLAPTASVRGDTEVPTGALARLDGQRSTSPEDLPLTYQWRLLSRPAGSAATPTDVDRVEVALVPDLPGDYVLELAVFDGELWSPMPATGTVRAAAP